MPIIETSRHIVIAHPILMYSPLAINFGHTAVELAIWLKLRNSLLEIEKPERLAEATQAFNTPENVRWNQRCLASAIRGHTPALATDMAELTPLGRERANQYHDMFIGFSYEDKRMLIELLERENWTKAEHVFINAELTKRQLKMVKLIGEAITDAEANNRTQLDKRFLTAITAEDEEKTENDLKAEDEFRKSEVGQMLEIFGPQDTARNTPQDFQAMIFPQGSLREAFVPTAMFGQRARNDLRNIIRHNMLDLRAWATGERGRPKHIVRVSPIGQIVVNDLVAQGYLR